MKWINADERKPKDWTFETIARYTDEFGDKTLIPIEEIAEKTTTGVEIIGTYHNTEIPYNKIEWLDEEYAQQVKPVSDEEIEKIRELRPTKEQVGDNSPVYAFGWTDAITAVIEELTNK